MANWDLFSVIPYSKLTSALHGFPAIAWLFCSTWFVLSIRNKHSNEINCRRVDRLVSPSWLSPSWFVADLTVAEVTGDQKFDAIRRDGLVVSALDQRPRGRGFETAGCALSGSNREASCCLHPGPGLTQPSILSRSVNEYRLQLGR